MNDFVFDKELDGLAFWEGQEHHNRGSEGQTHIVASEASGSHFEPKGVEESLTVLRAKLEGEY